MLNNQTISFPFDHRDLQLRVTYTATNQAEYIGRARPGALEGAAEWQICKVVYDANDLPISITWAEGSNDYSRVWTSRGTYTYS